MKNKNRQPGFGCRHKVELTGVEPVSKIVTSIVCLRRLFYYVIGYKCTVFDPQQLPVRSYCVLEAATRLPLLNFHQRLYLSLVITSPLGRKQLVHNPVEAITVPYVYIIFLQGL